MPPELKAEMEVKSKSEEGEGVKWEWKKGMDTMDVWFDSGSSWSMLEERESEGRPRADVCLEGSDQHRGWFQSLLLTSLGADEQAGSASTKGGEGKAAVRNVKAPYGTLITHGMVLDQKGKKMSKSLGNIISPMMVIYGGKVCFDALSPPFFLGLVAEQTRFRCCRIRRKNRLMGQMSYDCGRPQLNIGVICPSVKPSSVRVLSRSGRSVIPQDLHWEISGTERPGSDM